MKTNNLNLIVLGVILILTGCQNTKETEKNGDVLNEVKANFQNPSQEYGVNCWWWWLNGNVTRAAITKDLEAMKSRNFQGAMIFDAGGHNQRGNKDTDKFRQSLCYT